MFGKPVLGYYRQLKINILARFKIQPFDRSSSRHGPGGSNFLDITFLRNINISRGHLTSEEIHCTMRRPSFPGRLEGFP